MTIVLFILKSIPRPKHELKGINTHVVYSVLEDHVRELLVEELEAKLEQVLRAHEELAHERRGGQRVAQHGLVGAVRHVQRRLQPRAVGQRAQVVGGPCDTTFMVCYHAIFTTV